MTWTSVAAASVVWLAMGVSVNIWVYGYRVYLDWRKVISSFLDFLGNFLVAMVMTVIWPLVLCARWRDLRKSGGRGGV